MSSDSVTELVRRASAGDGSALGELVAAHLPSIEAYVRLRVGKMLHRRESCLDIAQSACRDALAGLGDFEFRGHAEFRAWLFLRASHKITEKARHHFAACRDPQREVSASPRDDGDADGDDDLVFGASSICSPSRHAMAKEDLARFEEAFAALPEDHREAVALHRIAGLGYEEIAARMQRSEGAVRNLVYRGLAKITMAMGNRTGDTRASGERSQGT